MFQVIRKSDNRLDIDLAGKLDKDTMQKGLDELFSKAVGIEHGRMLCRIGDFDMPTLGAIGVELSRLPQLFRFIRQFDRAAVVSSKEWLRKAAEIEGALIPGLEVRSFRVDQEAEAEAWLAN